MIEPQIKLLAEHHLEELASLEAVAAPHPWNLALLADELRLGAVGCGVWREERLIGHVLARSLAGEWHLLTVVVDPAWRNQGWGGYLLDWVLARAMAEQATAALLEVRAGNHAAQRLYHGRGFVRVGVRKRYYPPPEAEDAVVMRKILARDGNYSPPPVLRGLGGASPPNGSGQRPGFGF